MKKILFSVLYLIFLLANAQTFTVDNLVVQGTAIIPFTQKGTGAVAQTLDSKNKQIVNVKDFGATGNGTTDDTAALQLAAATGYPLLFSPGTYKISATIAFTNSITASNAAQTTISSTLLTAPTSTISCVNCEVKNLHFTHSSAPTAGSGANGLNILAGSYQINVNSNVANYNDNGFVVLTGSSALWLSKNNSSNNSESGFILQDANYIVESNIATDNGLYGYYGNTVSGGAGLQMTDNLSFNNANDGYHFVGTSGATLNDIYLSNNISSYDRGNGFFFDTYGINFLLANNYSEYNGYTTGNTIYSNASVGYSFSANNGQVSLVGSEGYHAASHGLYNAGSNISIAGGIFNLNGQGSGGGYGLAGTSAGFTQATGCELIGNISGAESLISSTYASVFNCQGVSNIGSVTGNSLSISGNATISGNITASGLATSGTIADSLCSTSSGGILSVSGANCYSASATATTATNIAGGAAGSIAYQTSANTTAMLSSASGVLVGGTTPSYSTSPTLTATNFSGTAASLNIGGNATTSTTATNQSGGTVAATTISASGVITSTLATGTPAFALTSTTQIPNLNVSYLQGTTWSSPLAYGSVTPNSVSATTISASGLISPNGTIGILGNATGSATQAGSIGEKKTSLNTAVGLTSGAVTNVTSIQLSAGSWTITGQIYFATGTGTTTTLQQAAINSSVAFPSAPDYIYNGSALAANVNMGYALPTIYVSTNGTPTYYCVAQANFSVSLEYATCRITAIRNS